MDCPPANRPCLGTVVKRCGSNPNKYSPMYSRLNLQFVSGVIRDLRFKTFHACLSAHLARHGTKFIYPEDHFHRRGRVIEVDDRCVRKVNLKYYLDPYMHAPNEVPLVPGSQFGVFAGFPFPDEVLVGIVGKNLFSGAVSGMTIGVVSREKGLVRTCSDDWAPWVLKHELISAGSRAYSLHR